MTCARKDIHDPETEGFFHCFTRCVRRSFLCGLDALSGKSYDHRKAWISARLAELVGIFAIECLAYAIMDNHLHSLLHTLPALCRAWADEEVARRWRLLFPLRRLPDGRAAEPSEEEIKAITCQPELVKIYRNRLSDISWFNRCLNEHIARRANAEDNCTGRFWEGRFKCQLLESEGAVISCSVYIDLNRVRAGSAKTPEESDYTSIQDRIRAYLGTPNPSAPKLGAFSEVIKTGLSDKDYILLVDQSARLLKDGKHALDEAIAPIFKRLGIKAQGWPESIQAHRRLFRRVVSPLERLKALALEKGKAWFQGKAASRLLFM
jgi:REP element-mobilizing transposase RayT